MNSNLNDFLINQGLSISPAVGKMEGYLSESQKKQFCDRLKTYLKLEKIAEIGFNAGHSTENFLTCCPNLKSLVSFDLGVYPCTDPCSDYLKSRFGEKFHFVKGDSKQTIPSYVNNYPTEKFDLIYIDGDHNYEPCMTDLINCALLATHETILWIDDYDYFAVFSAVHEQVHLGLIELLGVYESDDPKTGKRCWVEAKYILK